MQLIEILRENRNVLATLTLLIMLTFIYGCQCEGGIGNFSDNSEAVKTESAQTENR
jgi:hypothetical protein